MVAEIKPSKKEDRNDQLVLSNMLAKEYAIVEKLYEEPITGEGVGSDGKFEWTLYTLALHELCRFDLSGDEPKKIVDTFDGKEVTFFKSAKSFTTEFDKLPVNTKVKITQEKVEGKAYSVFKVEKVGEGNASPSEPDKKAHNPFDKIKSLKAQGVDLESVKKVVKAEFEGQTDASVEALYNAA